MAGAGAATPLARGGAVVKDRGEEWDPAVSPDDEWATRGRDQLSQAAELDDPVEALELSRLGSAAETAPSDDATELADQAAPAPPEEAALTEATALDPEADELTVGLGPEIDLDRLSEAPTEQLVEAEVAAADTGDPETAALIAAERERRSPPA
jgi:hypothetical protein